MDSIIKYAKENNIPIMEDEGINFLTDFINKKKIINILELGTAIGYSAIMMANIDENIKVVSIEKDLIRYSEALNNVKKYNLENQIELINSDIFDYDTDKRFDLIFIDAAKAQNTNFFLKFSKNLNSNGYIVTDNLKFHGLANDVESIKGKNLRALVKKINLYVDFLKENKEFKTDFFDIGDGISVSYRS